MRMPTTVEAPRVPAALPASWEERVAGAEREIARIRAQLADLWTRLGGNGGATNDDPPGKPAAAPRDRAGEDARLSAIEREIARIKRQLEAIRARIQADNAAPMPDWDNDNGVPRR